MHMMQDKQRELKKKPLLFGEKKVLISHPDAIGFVVATIWAQENLHVAGRVAGSLLVDDMTEAGRAGAETLAAVCLGLVLGAASVPGLTMVATRDSVPPILFLASA